MTNILVAAMPAPGHVNPMLTVASHLRDCGYRVVFNTSEVFRNHVESAHIRFVPLEGFANFDYRRLDDAFPERKNFAPGPDQLAHDFKYGFGRPIPDQYRGIRKIMNELDVDLIMTDVGFIGTFPLLLGSRNARPPIVSCGVLPMFLGSAKGADAGMLEPVQQYMNQLLNECGAPPMPAFFLDCLYTLPDHFLQFTAEAFEFPRSDMPPNVRFVGPLLPKASWRFQKPDWWGDLDGSKPVVLVTQGTIANEDSSQLIEPVLTGLGGEDVLLVVANGGRDLAGISAPIPPNAIVERFIPFDEILPRVDVFVTNGGYGGVNQALSMGVPVVVAGMTEDKPLVAARVAWSGAGINLETDRPSPDQVRTAIRTVLSDSGYRQKARLLQTSFAQYDALHEIAETVDTLLGAGVSQP